MNTLFAPALLALVLAFSTSPTTAQLPEACTLNTGRNAIEEASFLIRKFQTKARAQEKILGRSVNPMNYKVEAEKTETGDPIKKAVGKIDDEIVYDATYLKVYGLAQLKNTYARSTVLGKCITNIEMGLNFKRLGFSGFFHIQSTRPLFGVAHVDSTGLADVKIDDVKATVNIRIQACTVGYIVSSHVSDISYGANETDFAGIIKNEQLTPIQVNEVAVKIVNHLLKEELIINHTLIDLAQLLREVFYQYNAALIEPPTGRMGCPTK